MRESLNYFTKALKGLSPEEKDIAIGGAIQELASSMEDMADAQKDASKRTEELHRERVDLANQRHQELVDLINRRVDETEDYVQERMRKLDEHVVEISQCRVAHERILEDLQVHAKNDVSIDAWLGSHATAIIKAVLVFVGGAVLAYTWKQVTGL